MDRYRGDLARMLGAAARYDVVYVSSRRLDPALIEREHPDVAIEEFVERSLAAPTAFPIAP